MENIGLTLLWLLVLVPLAVHLATILLAGLRHGGSEPAAPRPDPAPKVTLIRPVCGIDETEIETLESSFTLDYPDLELIFCVGEESDPALPWLHEALARHPEADARILVGDSHFSGNPKLNNVQKGWHASTGEIVVMTDSNLLLPRDYILRILERFDSGTGMVSGPPWGAGPLDFWAAVECAFLNTNQARWQLAADSLGIGFAQGKTLAYRRDVLEAGGGVEALAANLAEDLASTKLVRRQGLRVRLTRRLFPQPVPHRTPRAVWNRQLRWSQIRREGFPLIFLFEILQGPFLPLIALLLLAWLTPLSWLWAPALLVLWYLAEIWLARRAGWPCGARDIAAMGMRDLMLPLLWCRTWTGGRLEWRGNAVTSTDEAQAKAKEKAGNAGA